MHEEVGKIARDSADLLVGVGELAKLYQADHWFPDSDQAAKNIVALLREADTILVKGSRAVKMENIVKELDGSTH
jgi:UDP-N-acetylmuramyl pentapeptide synthase